MKRCMSICCVFAMALGLSFGVSTDTQAASSVKVIDGSKLTTDAESIGFRDNMIYDYLAGNKNNVIKLHPLDRDACIDIFDKYKEENNIIY